jgi:hypothetical protein
MHRAAMHCAATHPARIKPRAQNRRRIEALKPAANARSAPSAAVGADGGAAAADGAKAVREAAMAKAPHPPTGNPGQPMAAVTTGRAPTAVGPIRVAATRIVGRSPHPHRNLPRRSHFRRRRHLHRAWHPPRRQPRAASPPA